GQAARSPAAPAGRPSAPIGGGGQDPRAARSGLVESMTTFPERPGAEPPAPAPFAWPMTASGRGPWEALCGPVPTRSARTTTRPATVTREAPEAHGGMDPR